MKAENNFKSCVLPFHHARPQTGTLVVRFYEKYLDPLGQHALYSTSTIRSLSCFTSVFYNRASKWSIAACNFLLKLGTVLDHL